MKAITTSNRRPQCRALCALLLGIAALWALPSIARAAQLFVSQSNAGSVGEYDATTGAAINASFITGLNRPLFGIAVSGKHFFVVNNDTTVGEYDATTGEAINASFITGLNGPLGLAVSGNTLFVTNNGDGTVGEYNATTGAAMNPRLITLSGPADLAVSDNDLFVVYNSTTVGEYDATTGAAINANLITGLLTSFGLAVSGNHLFVTNFFESTVREYSATTGDAINPLFVTGLDEPDGLTVSGNTLFVSSGGSGLALPSGNVGEYDASTGAAVNASLITGLNGPTGLAVGAVPEPSPWSIMACGGGVFLGIMLRNKRRISRQNVSPPGAKLSRAIAPSQEVLAIRLNSDTRERSLDLAGEVSKCSHSSRPSALRLSRQRSTETQHSWLRRRFRRRRWPA